MTGFDDNIQFSMGPLGTIDARLVLAVIHALKNTDQLLDDGVLAHLSSLVAPFGSSTPVLRTALAYSGLDDRYCSILSGLLYTLLRDNGAPTYTADDGTTDLDIGDLMQLSTADSKRLLADALRSLGNTITLCDTP